MCGALRGRELQLQNRKAGALCMENATFHLTEMIDVPGWLLSMSASLK
jgi:hypothetical protein